MARKGSFGGYDEARFVREADNTLQCAICQKVLKDPVQCSNEHYFCRSCIQEHFRQNSETCPTCRCHMTEETMTKPPRILLQMLLALEIRCDYASRGCGELMKLEFLAGHVRSCGYAPTRCTNQGCSQVMNQRDQQRHESELCHFRKISCEECGQELLWSSSRVHACFMRKDVDDLATRLARRLNVVEKDMSEVKNDVKQIKLRQEEFIKEVRNMMARAASQDDVHDLRRMRDEMNNMRAEIASLTHYKEEATERSDLFTGRHQILVCGGRDDNHRFNTVESYSWPENAWTPGPPMREKRSGTSAFVHGRQIFVSGGCTGTKDTDSIESLNVDEEHKQWIKLHVQMPMKCSGHKMICHENSAILTGGTDGNNVSDGIHQIQLNPPHTTKLLTQMQEPRYFHGCEIIDNQIMIAGGTTSNCLKDAKNTVYLYDIDNNECKPVAPLPFAVTQMATVTYKGNVILIGGVNEKRETLKKVIMYDFKTGKIKMLPNLKHKRAACAAVIAANVIMVMGGYVYETNTKLDSVECLDLNNDNVWRELSPMRTRRSHVSAVIMPAC